MEFLENDQKIWLEDESGKVTAYVEFPEINGTCNVMHTVVDPSLRGQGIGGKLLSALVKKWRKRERSLSLPARMPLTGLIKTEDTKMCLSMQKKSMQRRLKRGKGYNYEGI